MLQLDLLTNVLLNHMDDLLKLESCELYSLFSVVDAGISKVMSYESKDVCNLPNSTQLYNIM